MWTRIGLLSFSSPASSSAATAIAAAVDTPCSSRAFSAPSRLDFCGEGRKVLAKGLICVVWVDDDGGWW